jgi:UDP-N-acetylglucosamine diphosphorylase/glucosamine-1-phosphate N-acetyltransferase
MPLNLILFDDEKRNAFLPLVYTRPVAELRLGINTIKEKWERALQTKSSYLSQEYLNPKYPITLGEDNILINARYLPNDYLISLLKMLDLHQAIMSEGDLVAVRLSKERLKDVIDDEDIESLDGMEIDPALFHSISKPWEIFLKNGLAIESDLLEIKRGRVSQPLSSNNTLIGDDQHLFIEEGAIIQGATINTTTGPVYIGKHAEIMEGAMIRGPLALLDHAKIKMGAKIYGASTFGPYCKVGGEINNSVIIGYSNKGHDGFLGNALLGEWCNLGADTNNSNLKNNYGEIRLWNYDSGKFDRTGQQFCGLIMGDHSKSGINTMFNTGTVVGVAANIFGGSFPRTFIPSFAWGGSNGYSSHNFEKACETAERMMQRRSIEFTDHDRSILEHIMNSTVKYRSWEK